MSFQLSTKWVWKQYFEQVTLNPPVKDTAYVVLNVTGGARLKGLRIKQTNTEMDAKNITVRVQTDTTNSAVSDAYNNNSFYDFYRDLEDTMAHADADTPYLFGLLNTIGAFGNVESNQLIITLTLTSVAGTAQTLKYSITYDKLEAA